MVMTRAWGHPSYEAVVHLLGTRTGLAFAPERRAAVEQGIRAAMARAGIADPAQYQRRVATDDAVLDDLIVELTVGETYFFREPGQFEFLRTTVLPEIRSRRGDDHVIHAWSAACASGEEAYSLAILFLEEGLARRCHLLATDISRAALEKAWRASFGPWSLRDEGAAIARPYLIPGGGRFTVSEAVRRLVTFEYLNLALDIYPSLATGTRGMDVIFCRNVLIYFDRETVRAVARRLFASLAEGGWLLTASSDPPLGGEAPFETVVTDRGVFYRRGAAAATAQVLAAWDPIDPILTVVSPPAAASAPDPATPPPAPVAPSRQEPAPAPAQAGGAQGDVESVLAAAREDLARGDYDRAVERTRGLGTAEAAALLVRALANLELVAAELACAEAAARHPLSSELHYLRAVLLLGLGIEAEAAHAARRAIYLDRSLAIAHFTLGSILQRRGDRIGARRAYRNARDLCAARPADEVVPLTDGELAGRLAAAAEAQITRLDHHRTGTHP
jgi:chemotaxis protein methyltransferase CheR